MKTFLKIIFLIGFLPVIQSHLNAQQSITWQKLYNGPSHLTDLGFGVCQINDGNFIVVGTTQIPFYSVYVLKLNSYGDTIWTKIIGGYPPGQLAYAVTMSNDGGFVFTGDADTAFAIKMDTHGNIMWYKRFGKYRYVQCYDITNSPDGGYIGCGRILQGGGYIFKVDSTGNLEWEKIIQGEFVFLYSITLAHNAGFILSGSIYDTVYGDTTQSLVVRIDNQGNTLWQKRFSFLEGAKGKCIRKLNSGYLLSGNTSENLGSTDPISHIYFIRLDTNGNSIYSKIYKSSVINLLGSLTIINDNKYLFAISSDSANLTNAELIIADSIGNILNQKIYPSVKYLYLESSEKTSNGDFIFTGWWGKSGTADRDDIYVLKTDSNLNAPPIVNILSNHLEVSQDFRLYPSYPNPFNPYTTIKFELKQRANVKLKIYDTQGKMILELLSQTKAEGFYAVKWDASNYNSGVYFCQMIVNDKKLKTIKLILLR